MISLLNEIDRDKFKRDFFASVGFPRFCIDNSLKEEFAEDVLQSFLSFQEAQKIGKEFSAVNEKRKVQITDSAKFAPAIKKLSDLLASKEYVDMWSDLTGMPNLLGDADLIGGGYS